MAELQPRQCVRQKHRQRGAGVRDAVLPDMKEKHIEGRDAAQALDVRVVRSRVYSLGGTHVEPVCVQVLTMYGLVPAGNGEPFTAAKTPLAAAIENADTSFVP
jgi:hypothetical protein